MSEGERKDGRAVIDRVTERQINSGVRPEVAHQRAREAQQRIDRKQRDDGGRTR